MILPENLILLQHFMQECLLFRIEFFNLKSLLILEIFCLVVINKKWFYDFCKKRGLLAHAMKSAAISQLIGGATGMILSGLAVISVLTVGIFFRFLL
jgi:hypothetical protein